MNNTKIANGEIINKMFFALRGNWTDEPCYYVTVIDGERSNALAGPFRTHQEALNMVSETTRLACEYDAKGHWYAYGTAKLVNGHRDGLLNSKLGI